MGGHEGKLATPSANVSRNLCLLQKVCSLHQGVLLCVSHNKDPLALPKRCSLGAGRERSVCTAWPKPPSCITKAPKIEAEEEK